VIKYTMLVFMHATLTWHISIYSMWTYAEWKMQVYSKHEMLVNFYSVLTDGLEGS
jgi:hypothetical protein